MGMLTDLATGGAGKELKAIGGLFKKRKSSSSGSSSSGSSDSSSSYANDESMATYHRGGKVRKTGPARLRKGEHVLTGKQFKRMRSKRR